MKEQKAYYVPLSVIRWSSCTVGGPGNEIRLNNNSGKSIGFLQAYESLENLKKEHGDDQEYATFFEVTT